MSGPHTAQLQGHPSPWALRVSALEQDRLVPCSPGTHILLVRGRGGGVGAKVNKVISGGGKHRARKLVMCQRVQVLRGIHPEAEEEDLGKQQIPPVTRFASRPLAEGEVAVGCHPVPASLPRPGSSPHSICGPVWVEGAVTTG